MSSQTKRQTVWDDEKNVELLKELWLAGLSASQIAARIGGITRMAVIGKAHRLKLPSRLPRVDGARQSRINRRQRRAKRESKARVRMTPKNPLFELLCEPLPEEPADDIATTTVLERQPNQCGWPIGEPAEMKCCGAEVVPHLPYGSPYCRKHAQRAFALPTVSRGGFVLQDMKDANARKYARAAGEILEKEKEAA